MSTVTMLSWNLEKGIHLRAGAAWMRRQDPDIIFRQEVLPGQCEEEAELLGMDGYRAVSTPGSKNDNAIYLKKDGPLVLAEEHTQEWAPWHAPANISVQLRAPDGNLSPRQIHCVSGHSCYWSPTYQKIEAEWCSTLSKVGWLAVQFWDWNSYREGEGQSWDGVNDHAYYANRTSRAPGGHRESNEWPDRELRDAGYTEMARHARDHLGQPRAMNPTAGYRPHPRRPSGVEYAIDRGYMVHELAPALREFTVCDSPRLRELSDHLPQIARFDYAVLNEITHRDAAHYRAPQATS